MTTLFIAAIATRHVSSQRSRRSAPFSPEQTVRDDRSARGAYEYADEQGAGCVDDWESIAKGRVRANILMRWDIERVVERQKAEWER
jgi:hypothetical protein